MELIGIELAVVGCSTAGYWEFELNGVRLCWEVEMGILTLVAVRYYTWRYHRIEMVEASVDSVVEGVAMESFGEWVVMEDLEGEWGYLWRMEEDREVNFVDVILSSCAV